MTLPKHLKYPQLVKKLNSPFSVRRRGKKLVFGFFFPFFPPSYLMLFLGKKTKYIPSEIPTVTIYNILGTVLPNNPNPTAMSIFLLKPVSIVHGDEGCPLPGSSCVLWVSAGVRRWGTSLLQQTSRRNHGPSGMDQVWCGVDLYKRLVFYFLFFIFYFCKHMFGKVLGSLLERSLF